MEILFTNQTKNSIPQDLFTPILEKAESLLGPFPEKEVELAFISDKSIREINRETRQKDCPTDVLSFANREIADPAFPKGDSLGEIYISVQTAQKNADEMDQSLEEELQFLFIHGFLHLLGYDHQTEEEEEIMKKTAYQILGRD